MTIGLAGDRRAAGGEIDDAEALIAEHRRFERADDDEQIARTGRGYDGRKYRYGDGRLDIRRGLRKPHHDVGSHRMPEHRKPAIAAGQLACPRRDIGQFRQQRGGDRLAFGDVAAHRRRVAAVPEKIEGHGNIAVARQRFREGLHQLLGAGKAVGDHDDWGRGRGLRSENRDRRFAYDVCVFGDAVRALRMVR